MEPAPGEGRYRLRVYGERQRAVERNGGKALVTTDPAEVVRAVRLPARIIGINHRDLRTFTVDTTLAKRMRPDIPPDRVIVAESGIKTASDVHGLRAAGINAILVGETLMRGDDPGRALRELLSEP